MKDHSKINAAAYAGGETIKNDHEDAQGIVVRISYRDLSGAHTVKRAIYADRPLTIGRSEDCKLCLIDDHVSSLHARLSYDSLNNMVLEDCASTNGVYINGERVFVRGALSEGDTLRIGDCVLDVQVLGFVEDFDGNATIDLDKQRIRPISLRLEYADDNGEHRDHVILRQFVRIGRNRDNDIVLDSPRVSAWHARLIGFGTGRVAVEDLNTANGVFVNGEKIQKPYELLSRDVITLGDVEMKVLFK